MYRHTLIFLQHYCAKWLWWWYFTQHKGSKREGNMGQSSNLSTSSQIYLFGCWGAGKVHFLYFLHLNNLAKSSKLKGQNEMVYFLMFCNLGGSVNSHLLVFLPCKWMGRHVLHFMFIIAQPESALENFR